MGAIAEAIVNEIRERHERHRGHPDRELTEHLLIAVQRERIAAVGYDTERLGARLARSQLPDATRRDINRAIAQIWLDENMHARYILGVLLRQRELSLQLGAYAEHIEGGVGGWMTAVEQHTPWRDAPTTRLTAALIGVGGNLSGRIPPEVRESLSYGPLRRWCLFSADAEESAVLSFDRMRQLAAEIAPGSSENSALALPEGFSHELARMTRDERLHQQIFETIAAHLDDDDALLPGHSADDLGAALARIEGWQSSAGMHGSGRDDLPPSPVCTGGTVSVARGSTPDDKLATLDQALRESRFFEQIEQRTASLGRDQALVAIKVDLMHAYHREDPSTYVDPALIEHLVAQLAARGYRNLVVCDAQNFHTRYYANRSIERIAAYVGLRPGPYRLVDLATEQEPHTFTHGMGAYAIGRTWRDATARVSFAKLKTHPTATAQLTVRNAGTVIPQTGEHFFADRLVDFTSLTTAILREFPPHFGLIDGYDDAADGLLGVMADPTPKHPRLIVAGADVVSVDFVAMHLMGERDPMRAPDLRAAIEQFGDPRPHGEALGDLTPIPDWDRADAGLLAAPLAALASPVYASLSQRGALFTADMDPDAFPAIGETRPLAAARRALRALLGIERR